jgi:hypothetical protein
MSAQLRAVNPQSCELAIDPEPHRLLLQIPISLIDPVVGGFERYRLISSTTISVHKSEAWKDCLRYFSFACSALACFRMGMPGSSMRTLIGNDRIGNNDFNFAVAVASDRLSRRYYLPGPTRSLMGGTFTVSQVNAKQPNCQPSSMVASMDWWL